MMAMSHVCGCIELVEDFHKRKTFNCQTAYAFLSLFPSPPPPAACFEAAHNHAKRREKSKALEKREFAFVVR